MTARANGTNPDASDHDSVIDELDVKVALRSAWPRRSRPGRTRTYTFCCSFPGHREPRSRQRSRSLRARTT